MLLTGVITDILEVKEGTTKNDDPWKAVDFAVLETGVEHPQKGCFSLFSTTHATYGNKVERFKEECVIGSNVEIDFKIDMNEWNEKYYTKLKVWQVKNLDRVQAANPATGQQAPVNIPAEMEGQDDLPF